MAVAAFEENTNPRSRLQRRGGSHLPGRGHFERGLGGRVNTHSRKRGGGGPFFRFLARSTCAGAEEFNGVGYVTGNVLQDGDALLVLLAD